MFHERFTLFPEDPDKPQAEYNIDEGWIEYFLPNITDGGFNLTKIITHEWLHGLIDWATEGDVDKHVWDAHDCTGDADHFIMARINYADGYEDFLEEL